MNEKRLIARWETRGNDYLELYYDPIEKFSNFYSYRGNGCGIFEAANDAEAIERMEAPWGDKRGTGQVTVLKTDRPSLKRVF